MTRYTVDHLARMADQIAANLATEGDPVAAAADHIAKFWTPAMISQLGQADAALSPTASAALAKLAAHG